MARSADMMGVVATLDRLRGHEAPVLIRGETGSGKELIARVVHEESPRRAQPFVIIDVASLSPGLIELELFGARAGAFTDLKGVRQGLIAAAAGGTVLLDEVASLPLEAQAKLLRVLGDGTIRPLGADRGEQVDVRFLFSTAQDLEVEVREGRSLGWRSTPAPSRS